jgi:hypothetical protein
VKPDLSSRPIRMRVYCTGVVRRHADWDAIDRAAPREVPYMDAELAGTKRVPQPTGE